MPRFITRVELRGAKSDDYEKLHNAMEKKRYSRNITSGDGITYHLPLAEYYRYGAGPTRRQVQSDAQEAAATVWKKCYLLVTDTGESGNICWDGLQRV